MGWYGRHFRWERGRGRGRERDGGEKECFEFTYGKEAGKGWWGLYNVLLAIVLVRLDEWDVTGMGNTLVRRKDRRDEGMFQVKLVGDHGVLCCYMNGL